jgi:hypothetical protein
MKKMTFEIPVVSQCMATECAYNVGNNCHARAITIGDGLHPGCDTYFRESRHIRKDDQIAGIGACKIGSCKFNDDFECMADSIRVDKVQNQVSCMTFSSR